MINDPGGHGERDEHTVGKGLTCDEVQELVAADDSVETTKGDGCNPPFNL